MHCHARMFSNSISYYLKTNALFAISRLSSRFLHKVRILRVSRRCRPEVTFCDVMLPLGLERAHHFRSTSVSLGIARKTKIPLTRPESRPNGRETGDNAQFVFGKNSDPGTRATGTRMVFHCDPPAVLFHAARALAVFFRRSPMAHVE